MTNSISEVDKSDFILVTGSNTTEAHPIIGSDMRRAVLNGAKLVVIEPRRIDLVENAEYFLQIKPGTNIAILNGLMNVIIEEDLMNKDFINNNTENYEELVKVVKDYTPDKVAEICGVDAEDIIAVARLYAKANAAAIYYAMGITQHTTGTNAVMSIANLAMLCGQIGREGTGVNPLRGQNNVQGACDMGALPADFPGYQKVYDDKNREKFEKAWGVPLNNKPGLTVTEMMSAADKNDIRFLYIMGENPAVSDPDTNHVLKVLEKTEFLVVQDLFMTETAQYADVVLPASSFAEKDGTFVNTERRVQRIRKAIEPIGESKADWMILAEIIKRLGVKSNYKDANSVFREIARLTPIYSGITYDRLEEKGIQWPCKTKKSEGTKFLHKDGNFMRGKGLFVPSEYTESAHQTSEEFPYILTTGRNYYHYHTRTMTAKTTGIDQIVPEQYIEINPDDASRLGLSNNDRVKVTSNKGEVTPLVAVTDRVYPGVVFMTFHFGENGANYLTSGDSLDSKAKIPELKVTAVNLSKI